MQIKTLHPLAVTYNDQSPLENHHHAAAVRLLLQPEYRYLPVSLRMLMYVSSHAYVQKQPFVFHLLPISSEQHSQSHANICLGSFSLRKKHKASHQKRTC